MGIVLGRIKMQATQSLVVLFALIAAVGIQQGWAFKCYQCNSGGEYEGKDCMTENLKKEFYLDCAGKAQNFTMCRKMTQNVGGDTRIIRQCAETGTLGRCVERTGTKG